MKQKKVSTKRLDQFGWKAKTSLKEGLTKTLDFYITNYEKN